ncbi:hypothetical protein [Chitinophaga sp. CF418]|uniref:hypothetical protein n=1 Tax=Chitinophaga sp. CF418 TaxID=1855287 RepID=UPI00091CC724|nr:hypothetical protein [Chitinophaga sp. CF418]SHM72162.1 hypothetical protein SAMN05216311_10358 [Chitinophaga sp. CF418]
MSTEKKSAIENVDKSLEIEKLSETEAGKLEGGFSNAISESDSDESGGGLNISKCYCTGAPTTD